MCINMCVCVCARARVCVCVCVRACVYMRAWEMRVFVCVRVSCVSAHGHIDGGNKGLSTVCA